jgi:hypothetical protein
MSDAAWEHILTALLAAIPATIAAISSVRNGHAIKGAHESTKRLEKEAGRSAKMESGGRWYQPPSSRS